MAKILVPDCCYLEFYISDRGEKLQTVIEKLQTIAKLGDERKRPKAVVIVVIMLLIALVIVVKLLVRFSPSWQW